MAEKEENTATLGSFGNYDSDIFQMRLAEIRAMPDGAEKDQALKDLTQDYEGLSQIYSQDLAEAAHTSDVGEIEGTQSGNVYVAPNGLQALSSVLRQGFGGYQRKQARDAMKELSDARTRGGKALAAAGARSRAGGDQASIHDAPVAEFAAAQAEAGVDKPTLESLTSQRPGLNQGLEDITKQAMTPEAQVGRAMERRGKQRQQGQTPPPVGQGAAGQMKQAALLRQMGKPDMSQYGRETGNAGMGQQTPRPDKPYYSGERPAPYNPRGAAISQGMTDRMNPNYNEEEERRKMLFGLMNRHSGGY